MKERDLITRLVKRTGEVLPATVEARLNRHSYRVSLRASGRTLTAEPLFAGDDYYDGQQVRVANLGASGNRIGGGFVIITRSRTRQPLAPQDTAVVKKRRIPRVPEAPVVPPPAEEAPSLPAATGLFVVSEHAGISAALFNVDESDLSVLSSEFASNYDPLNVAGDADNLYLVSDINALGALDYVLVIVDRTDLTTGTEYTLPGAVSRSGRGIAVADGRVWTQFYDSTSGPDGIQSLTTAGASGETKTFGGGVPRDIYHDGTYYWVQIGSTLYRWTRSTDTVVSGSARNSTNIAEASGYIFTLFYSAFAFVDPELRKVDKSTVTVSSTLSFSGADDAYAVVGLGGYVYAALHITAGGVRINKVDASTMTTADFVDLPNAAAGTSGTVKMTMTTDGTYIYIIGGDGSDQLIRKIDPSTMTVVATSASALTEASDIIYLA